MHERINLVSTIRRGCDTAGVPGLFEGDDFAQTDLQAALDQP